MAIRAQSGWINDLWNIDFSLPNLVTPRAVLVTQADYLETHSEGVLDADVETAVLEDRMAHAFTLRATRLPAFRETMLTATHGVRLFPVTVQSDALKKPAICESMAAFETVLRSVLGSKETQALVRVLLTQSRELDAVKAEQRAAAGPNGTKRLTFATASDRAQLN